jgi:hypothetical protein
MGLAIVIIVVFFPRGILGSSRIARGGGTIAMAARGRASGAKPALESPD